MHRINGSKIIYVNKYEADYYSHAARISPVELRSVVNLLII